MAAAKVRTDRFLLTWKLGGAEPGLLRLEREDDSSAASPRTESGRSRSCGGRRVGRQRARAAPARQRRRPDGVEGLPQGGRGALRARRQLLGRQVPPAVRGERHAAAGPVLADLERAQPEEVLHPGATVAQSAQKYAQLLQISHDAIKARDPKAQIVLAGMPGFGDSKAWNFLNNLYAVPGIKNYFDVAALHPYARDLDEFAARSRSSARR